MCSPLIFYSGGLEVCVIFDNNVEEGFSLAFGQFTTHYFRYFNIHQQVNVNKVIMDHCKRYQRESLYDLKSMENEDQLKILVAFPLPFPFVALVVLVVLVEIGEVMMCKRCLCIITDEKFVRKYDRPNFQYFGSVSPAYFSTTP
ncbi:hypothetical protein ACTFIR_007039 [Dictyostelium discoideum]